MEPKDVMSVAEASRDLATLMATERRIPCLQIDGARLFSKKSIDKWRGQRVRCT